MTFYDSIPPHGAQGYNTSDETETSPFHDLGTNWRGSLRITSSRPIAAINISRWKTGSRRGDDSLSGPGEGHSTVIMPIQYKVYSGGNWLRWSAINIMNISSETVQLSVDYYDAAGNHRLGPLEYSRKPNQAMALNTRSLSGLPNDFEGSAVVTTSGGDALIAVGILAYPDRNAVYNGVGR